MSPEILQITITLVNSLGESPYSQTVIVYALADKPTEESAEEPAEEPTEESASEDAEPQVEPETESPSDVKGVIETNAKLSAEVSGKSIGEFYALKLLLRLEANKRVAAVPEGPKLPEARIQSISNDATLYITFTNEMSFPGNFTAILNDKHITRGSTDTLPVNNERLLTDELKGQDLLALVMISS